jgi:hypothetical protein
MEAEIQTAEASQQAATAMNELQSLVDRCDRLTMDLAIARRDLQQLRNGMQMFFHRWGVQG